MRRAIPLGVGVVLALTAGPSVSADEQRSDPPPGALDRWLEGLGSDSFIQRDFAGRQLLRRGTSSIAPLIGVAGGEDDVAAATAIRLLAPVARDDRGAMGAAAHRGLAELARDGGSQSPARRAMIHQALRLADRRVAGMITARGGRIGRDESLTVIDVEVHGTGFSDEDAVLLARLPDLKRLDLRETLISDQTIAVILELPQLQELNLSDTTVTGEGLLRLSALKSLTKLSVYRVRISPAQWQFLLAEFPDCEFRH